MESFPDLTKVASAPERFGDGSIREASGEPAKLMGRTSNERLIPDVGNKSGTESKVRRKVTKAATADRSSGRFFRSGVFREFPLGFPPRGNERPYDEVGTLVS